jgi:DNA-binding NarL/FixJ family response regulator
MKIKVEKLQLLIVDDHKMIRHGIKLMLETADKNKYKFIFDEAESGEEAIAKTNNIKYDIIIMDYQLPKMSGAEATKLIMKNEPKSKILALSNYDEYMYIDNMMAAGAKGYVLKNIGVQDLLNAIESILNGKNYYSNDVAVKIINFGHTEQTPSSKKAPSKFVAVNTLSKRELEIIQLIAAEFTNEEIANKLFISKRTVDTHRQNLLNKLGVKNTAGLVKYAMELKLTE